MALRGDLASVDLAQVFQMLAINQKVGLLSIQSRQEWWVLAFDQRGVTSHHKVHAVLEHVFASFVRTGRLTEEALEEVRDHAAHTGQSVVDGLLAGGYLEPEELEDRYREAIEEGIYDLFLCHDARFEFFENVDHLEGYDGFTDERFFFHCDSIVMEAARRIDEWAYISDRVPSMDAFFVAAVDSIGVDEFGADGAAVFELLDGHRSVRRVIDLTALSHFQACKALGQMIDAGAVEPVADEELVALAGECEEDGRLLDAIDLYERATALGIGGAAVHDRAAAAHRDAGHPADAARHLQAGAELLIADGDHAGGAAMLLEVRRLLPTALGVRERLLELSVGAPFVLPDFDPMAEGKEVVGLLLELGDVERVRHILERLLSVAPDDLDLKKALVSVHAKAGDQQRVAELYESIADDLVERGHALEAVGYLQKILIMDRTRTDISERVRDLYEHDEKNRRRSRLLGVLGTLFFLLLGVGTFYWFYDQRAAEEFARIDVSELREHQDYAGASMAYADFIRDYPFTTSVAAAQAELQEIEAEQQRFEAELANAKAVERRLAEKTRASYKRQWELHRSLFMAGKPEESMEVLERVRELIRTAGQPEDIEWALEQRVEHTWERLRDYLAGSAKLAEEFDAASAAGDWARAREVALRLDSEYENTAAARRVPVPVEVRTRPGGARLLYHGEPLVRRVDGNPEPLLTPTFVLCADADGVLDLVADLPGFEPLPLRISPREQASVEAVLAVVPAHRCEFPTRLQTGVGMNGGWIAVGLRGGRLGVSRVDGSGMRAIALPGLKAVDSTPVVDGRRTFFVSNENTVECVDLASGAPVEGWPAPLPNGAATELVVGSGRVVVVDNAGVLHCWEQSDGDLLWSVSLDATVVGSPTIHRRGLYVATTDGRVFLLDISTGGTVGVLRCEQPISTRVLGDGGSIVFGVRDAIRLVDVSTGRVQWETEVGHDVADGNIAVDQQVVCVAAGERLIFLDRGTGALLAGLPLEGELQRGLAVRDGKLYLRLRRAPQGPRSAHDVLQAIDVASLAVSWEFASVDVAAGFVACEDGVAFPASGSAVVVFR